MKLRDLIDEVKRLAANSPDNRYYRSPGSKNCEYDAGECADGSVGCIFGQALENLGHPPHGYGGEGIPQVLGFDYGALKANCRALVWCQTVQRLQDSGYAWYEAVSHASKSCPVLTGSDMEIPFEPKEEPCSGT
jgi:hypothetical protein